MKVEFKITETSQEEIVISCVSVDKRLLELKELIEDYFKEDLHLELYDQKTQYYLPLTKILFFETNGSEVFAHTSDKQFKVKYKMYELEEKLPNKFTRVAKSMIVNIDKIYSITRNITASSIIAFPNTSKKAYVSRSYYKNLKIQIRKRREKYEK
ncbi:MAG: LytTR family DNA-binding domain-containing protein [Erysipelotrichaceae bacterium]